MRYAYKYDHRWLIMVRRMEFELYITMSLERKVQSIVLWFIVSCYCAFAVFMNLLFGMKFAPTQATGWMMTAFSTLMMVSSIKLSEMESVHSRIWKALVVIVIVIFFLHCVTILEL